MADVQVSKPVPTNEDISQVLPVTLLPEAERSTRRAEIVRVTLAAGETFVFRSEVQPDYYLIVDQWLGAGAGTPFSVCYGPYFEEARSIQIAGGGSLLLPGANPYLTIQADATAGCTLVIMPLAGYPETRADVRKV